MIPPASQHVYDGTHEKGRPEGRPHRSSTERWSDD